MVREATPLMEQMRRLDRQSAYAQALAQCSRVLTGAPDHEETRQGSLNRALEPLRLAAQACRAHIFENYHDPVDGFCSGIRAEAHAPDAASHLELAFSQKIPWSTVPERNRALLAASQPIGGPCTRVFAGKKEMVEVLRRLGIYSVLFLPIVVDGQWWGYIGFDDCVTSREWADDDVALLHTAADLFGNVLHRWQIAGKLETQSRYQQALARCAQVLLRNPQDNEEKVGLIDSALESVRRALNASRAYFFRSFEDPELGTCAGITAMVCVPGIPCEITEDRKRVPWATLPANLVESFRAEHPFGGPIEEVFADAPYWRSRYLDQHPPLLSMQLVPLTMDGTQWGFIGVDDVVTARRWTEVEIDLLRTASEILGSALQRWHANENLEAEVLERTAELQQSNQRLRGEIEQRQHAEQRLQHRLDIEHMLANLSHRLLRQEMAEESWIKILQDLGQAVQAQWVLLIHLPRQGDVLGTQIVQWHHPEMPPLDEAMVRHFAQNCPWLWQQVSQGEAIHFTTWGQLPVAAETDRQFLSENEFNAVSLFPIPINGTISFLACLSNAASKENDAEVLRIWQLGANLIASRLRIDHILETMERRLVARTGELATLFDISMLASKADSLAEVLAPAVERIAETGNCQAICVHLLTPDSQALTLAAQQGLSPAECERVNMLSESVPDLLATVQPQPYVVPLPESSGALGVLRLASYRYYFGCQLRVRGRPIGLLSAYRGNSKAYSIDDISLLAALVELLAIVVENHRLYSEAQRTAIEAERQRLARELHDSITQSLYSQTIFARAGQYALDDRDDAKLRDSLQQLESGAMASLKEMRLLLFQLQPLVLEELTLGQAIQRRFQDVENKLKVRTVVDLTHASDFDSDTRFELYRIIMEALNNSLKHADATEVHVKSQEFDDHYAVTIGDNGVGFHVETITPGLGLKHLYERARKIQGTLKIESTPGAGTRVVVCLPK